jgi:hypothetical protein
MAQKHLLAFGVHLRVVRGRRERPLRVGRAALGTLPLNGDSAQQRECGNGNRPNDPYEGELYFRCHRSFVAV